MKIRDRIKELRRIPAKDLLPNPKNWRRHPSKQASALRGILAEVGYADALIARETENGLMLLDGHLRAETTPNQKVPVLILDVTEEEGDKILATLDPLAEMAQAGQNELRELLESIKTENEDLKALLEKIGFDYGTIEMSPDILNPEDVSSMDERSKQKCPKCGHEF